MGFTQLPRPVSLWPAVQRNRHPDSHVAMEPHDAPRQRLPYRGQSKKCLGGFNASRLCPVWRQKGTRAGLFPADHPLHGRQPIDFRRRRRVRLSRHCVVQYPLLDIAPCSPTVGLLAPELRDPCGLRIPRCCWKSSLAARRPAFARMGRANLDCIGIRETIHGSAGVPLVARSSRDLVGRPSARL